MHISSTSKRWVNTLRPRQNGRHFADDVFKCIFLNENVWISLKISLKFVPEGLINNIPSLVQIMAWRWPGDKPSSEAMMVSLLMHIYASLGLNELTHWSWNKRADIMQKTSCKWHFHDFAPNRWQAITWTMACIQYHYDLTEDKTTFLWYYHIIEDFEYRFVNQKPFFKMTK